MPAVVPPAAVAPIVDRGRLAAVIVSMRPGEWIKNVFVVPALVFSGNLDGSAPVVRTVATFVAFCAVASAGYLVNDVRDVELDRRHPVKHRRPIAAGQLAPSSALVVACALAIAGITLGGLAGWEVLAYLVGYAALTAAYTTWLKQEVILDVLAIAGCFLLRVLAGAAAAGAPASEWLIVCTGALAMFLGFTKRRQEAASELHDGTTSRPVLEHYSLPFLDQMVSMVTTGTVISYVLYAVDSPVIGSRMLPTTVPVLYGVFRYLYLVYHRNDGRSTAAMVRQDVGILAAGATWLAMAVVLLYA
jgi:4-hydroxybenzoate polyprenyltransferase